MDLTLNNGPHLLDRISTIPSHQDWWLMELSLYFKMRLLVVYNHSIRRLRLITEHRWKGWSGMELAAAGPRPVSKARIY